MLDSKQLAMWNAVGDIQESVQSSWGDQTAETADHGYPVTAELLEALDAALAAGADPNKPMSADEYYGWIKTRGSWLSGAYIELEAKVEALLQASQLTNIEYNEAGTAAPEDDRASCLPSSPQQECFYILSEQPDFEVVRRLIKAGANPNFNGGFFYGQDRLLHHLLRSSDLYHKPAETLIALLNAGAEVDIRDSSGQTPLHLACSDKLPGGFISILLQYGASVSALDDNGNTPLDSAAFHDEGYRIWPLDQDEAFGDDPPRNGNYCLWGAREAVNALIKAGADPNSINPHNGNTPMHLTVDYCYLYLEFAEALFERGGRADIPNNYGLRPIDLIDYHADRYGNKKAAHLRERFHKPPRNN